MWFAFRFLFFGICCALINNARREENEKSQSPHGWCNYWKLFLNDSFESRSGIREFCAFFVNALSEITTKQVNLIYEGFFSLAFPFCAHLRFRLNRIKNSERQSLCVPKVIFNSTERWISLESKFNCLPKCLWNDEVCRYANLHLIDLNVPISRFESHSFSLTPIAPQKVGKPELMSRAAALQWTEQL